MTQLNEQYREFHVDEDSVNKYGIFMNIHTFDTQYNYRRFGEYYGIRNIKGRYVAILSRNYWVI